MQYTAAVHKVVIDTSLGAPTPVQWLAPRPIALTLNYWVGPRGIESKRENNIETINTKEFRLFQQGTEITSKVSGKLLPWKFFFLWA